MKKTTIMRNIVTAIIALFISISPAAYAADGGGSSVPVDIKWLGYKNSSPVYQLSFNNEKEEEFIVVIRDNSGNVLYSEKLKGKGIVRKFQLVNEGEIDEEISFEVFSYKNKTTVKYRTTTSTEVVSNHSVVKVS